MSDQPDTEKPDRPRLEGDMSDVSHTPPDDHDHNNIWRRGHRRTPDGRTLGADDRAGVRQREDRAADE